MYKIIGRNGDIFGDEFPICEYLCDTEVDVATLPTNIADGTGGVHNVDDQRCSAGSSAYVVDTDALYKLYVLNTVGTWVPQK